MTAAEKAKEIYDKMENSITSLEGNEWFESAKQCAKICVDEIVKTFDVTMPQSIEYWKDVFNEIEKL